jgi:phage-related holin
MSEIRSVLENGDTNEVVVVIDRLQRFLPEYGKTRLDEVFFNLLKELCDIEERISSLRLRFREQALRILDSCESNWGKKEITKATGYDAG